MLCYVNQLTFFSGCIVLHSRRVNAARHCLTCLKAPRPPPRDDQGRDGLAPSDPPLPCVGQGAPRWQEDEAEGICRRITTCFNVVYPRALLHWAGMGALLHCAGMGALLHRAGIGALLHWAGIGALLHWAGMGVLLHWADKGTLAPGPFCTVQARGPLPGARVRYAKGIFGGEVLGSCFRVYLGDDCP